MAERIEAIETAIVDIPLRRAHAHAHSTTRAQSYVIVQLRTTSGIVGIGEGATPGGPWWGGDAVETIAVMIDRYLGPALLDEDVFRIEYLLGKMDRVAARNQFAKAPLDIALHDAVGKLLGVPISDVLGGRVRERIPVRWPLGAGTLEADVDEARALIAQGAHRAFKIKMGANTPEDDVERVLATAAAIGAPCTVDLNGAWDEPTAAKWLPQLEVAGIELVEAPVDGRNRGAMRRLADRLAMPIMADEGLWDLHDALTHIVQGATDVLAVKVAKGGGIRRAQKLAAIGEAAGLPLYGGTALESSLGTAASLQLFAALPSLAWGCESAGPLLLADDLAVEPVRYGEFAVLIPSAPGLGVTLDPEKLERYRRREYQPSRTGA